MSRAVELMVAHVEHLRKRYDRNLAELEEARRMMMQQQQQQQSSCRNITDPRASTGFCISGVFLVTCFLLQLCAKFE